MPTGANIFGAGVIDILDYANTNKYKTVRALSGHDNNGSGYVNFESGLWMSTSAITSIKLFTAGNVYAQYTQFALYGIKGA
jgi:predicted patatin/cPLA2 family phospholipase